MSRSRDDQSCAIQKLVRDLVFSIISGIESKEEARRNGMSAAVTFNISLPTSVACFLGPGQRIEVEDPEVKKVIREAVLKAAWALPYRLGADEGDSDDGVERASGYCASLTDGERIVLMREDGGEEGGEVEDGDGEESDATTVVRVENEREEDDKEEETDIPARPDSSTLATDTVADNNNDNDESSSLTSSNTPAPTPTPATQPNRPSTSTSFQSSVSSSFLPLCPPDTDRITVLVKDILGTIHSISMRRDLASTSRLRAKYSALTKRSRKDILLFTATGTQMLDGESLSQVSISISAKTEPDLPADVHSKYFLDASSSTVLALRASAPTFPAGVVRAPTAREKKLKAATAPLNALPRGSTGSRAEERRGLLDDEDGQSAVGSV